MRREALHVLLARVIPALPTEPADVPGDEAIRRCDFGASSLRPIFNIAQPRYSPRIDRNNLLGNSFSPHRIGIYYDVAKWLFARWDPAQRLFARFMKEWCFAVNFNRSHVASARYPSASKVKRSVKYFMCELIKCDCQSYRLWLSTWTHRVTMANVMSHMHFTRLPFNYYSRHSFYIRSRP